MVERKIEKSLNALNALNGEQESERKPTESASYRTRSQTTNHSTNKQILKFSLTPNIKGIFIQEFQSLLSVDLPFAY